jgi:sugar lactone lactonase YvrE
MEYIYFDGKTTVHYTSKQGLGDNWIGNIVEDKTGNIWFATGDGLTLFDPSNGGAFTTFTVNQGFSDRPVNSLTTDSQGNLWIAAGGLNFIDAATLKKIKHSPDFLKGQNGKMKNIFKTFTTDDGLPENRISNVKELRKGKMALSSKSGLTIFSYPVDSIENFNSLQNIETFNFQTGFPIRYIMYFENSVYVDDDGILWIANLSEESPLIRFDYDALHRKDKLPSVTIQQVKINEEEISWQTLLNINNKNDSVAFHTIPAHITEEIITFGKSLNEFERKNFIQKFKGIKFSRISKFFPVPENLVLPYKHNRITIDFGTNELSNPQLMEYQYILEGYDKEWSPVLKKTSATFGNMKEGKRTLRAEREKTQKRELEHAREIEKAYQNLEVAHENLNPPNPNSSNPKKWLRLVNSLPELPMKYKTR